ncbi:hypothetical protein Arno162_19 [Pectobacterium phage Arno162]|uniref:Uncharacterized protein n=2 Tax=Arnovirus TaxID=3425109 RepID=A0A678ZK07_9CAUD|nr:hypothetical protein Arno162_19 [Pectobacterium phage Arno162]AZV02204.1 hypothetical protein Arno18_18 [Pectobacterium phage Arno18]
MTTAAILKSSLKPEDVLPRLKAEGANLDTLTVSIEVFDFSRDLYGNHTSHYSADLYCGGKCVSHIVSTGSRREQSGYTTERCEHALYDLRKLGWSIGERTHYKEYSTNHIVEYKLLNKPE